MNSVARGNAFEDQIEKILRNGNIENYKIRQRTGSASWPQFAKVISQVTRLDVWWTAYCERPSLFKYLKATVFNSSVVVNRMLSDGDGGVDLMGNCEGNLLLIQCKNYSSDNKVTKSNVRNLEGTLSKYPENTIGVFVVPSKTDNYTRRAIEEAKYSRYKILLTDKNNICSEIENHLEDHKDHVENDNYIQFRVEGKLSNKYIIYLLLLILLILMVALKF